MYDTHSNFTTQPILNEFIVNHSTVRCNYLVLYCKGYIIHNLQHTKVNMGLWAFGETTFAHTNNDHDDGRRPHDGSYSLAD